MNKIFIIAKREMISFFYSPVAWIVAACFMFMSGFLFIGNSLSARIADMSGVMSNLSIFIFMICPVITMKLLADEKKNGSIELLLTSPVKAVHIVIGKYTGAIAFYAALLALTLLFPLYLEIRSDVQWINLFIQYLSAFLLGSTIIGAGLVCSSMTSSTVIAAVTAEAFGLGLFLLSWLTNEFHGAWKTIIEELTIISHYQSLLQGIFDFKDVVYFFVWILFTLFITVKTVESRL